MSDPIHDAVTRIRRLMSSHGVLSSEMDAALTAAEEAMREDWGGDRPYIAKRGERAGAMMSARNRAIILDWRAGERQAFISRKYGISRQRVQQIIDGDASGLP